MIHFSKNNILLEKNMSPFHKFNFFQYELRTYILKSVTTMYYELCAYSAQQDQMDTNPSQAS